MYVRREGAGLGCSCTLCELGGLVDALGGRWGAYSAYSAYFVAWVHE